VAKKKKKVIALERRVSQLQERIRVLEEEAQEANEKIDGLKARTVKLLIRNFEIFF
jgi:hypothetical protein